MTHSQPTKVSLYADGSCRPGGFGGWALILVQPGERTIEVSGQARFTTSCLMELFAIVTGLKLIRVPSVVDITTDSMSVIEGSAGSRKKRSPLWSALAKQLLRHKVTWIWVPGHKGQHPEHRRCHDLAYRNSKTLADSPWARKLMAQRRSA